MPKRDALPKKRKSGIPTGNAGEYFVMGELLKRGFDAQLADRNTKGYDLLVGMAEDESLRKVQVKTTASGQQWYVRREDFTSERRDQTTIYVLLGAQDRLKPVRYFIAKNRELAQFLRSQAGWKQYGFMPLKALEKYEDRWDSLRT